MDISVGIGLCHCRCGVRLLLILVNKLDAYGGKTKYVKRAWGEGVDLSPSNDSFFCDSLIHISFKNYYVKVHACVGGTSVCEDQGILSAGVHVMDGTPRRVFDMLRRIRSGPRVIFYLFMNKPLGIIAKREELTLEGIKQFDVNFEKEDWKLEALCDL